jgi:hypothetical protein
VLQQLTLADVVVNRHGQEELSLGETNNRLEPLQQDDVIDAETSTDPRA